MPTPSDRPIDRFDALEARVQRMNERLAALEEIAEASRPSIDPTSGTITLELTPKQAYWLKALTQNYVPGPGAPEDEPTEELAMRAAIFDMLPDFSLLAGFSVQQGGLTMSAIPGAPIEAAFSKSKVPGVHTFVYIEDPYNVRCARISLADGPPLGYLIIWDNVNPADLQFAPTAWLTSHMAMQHAARLAADWVERYYDHTESTFLDEPDDEEPA